MRLVTRISRLAFAAIMMMLMLSTTHVVAQTLTAPNARATVAATADASSSTSQIAIDALKTANAARTSANTAWVLIATVLVLMMGFPGLALFYAGLTREKNAVNTFLQVVVAIMLATLAFMLVGFGLAFGPGDQWIGSLMPPSSWFFLDKPMDSLYPGVNAPLFFIFQLAFAAVTVGIVLGASMERISFPFVILFVPLWVIFVYCPVARWVWSEHGWLHSIGAIDFAGGLVVHVCSGCSALALAIMLGKRRGFGSESFEPNSPALAALGAAILIVGWYGFNAGSALAADANATRALVSTHIAAAAGAVTWLVIELMSRRYTTLIGVLTGVIGGLVAITPASGYVAPETAVLIGAIGSAAAYLGAVIMRGLALFDDALDVFGVHATAGIVGSLLTGALASSALVRTASVKAQLIATAAVVGYAFVATLLLVAVLRLILKLRVSPQDEDAGLDLKYHGEPG
ncbi:MAG TPA: ammonium transporter [Burkholderiaceae bacterium]|nr:ammonium transporter [Burkholderiaceae bacterium]